MRENISVLGLCLPSVPYVECSRKRPVQSRAGTERWWVAKRPADAQQL